VFRLLKRGNGFLSFLAEIPKPDGGADADIDLVALEGFDQGWHDLGRVTFSQLQKTNRNDPVFLLSRIQISDQLLRRFLLSAAAAR